MVTRITLLQERAKSTSFPFLPLCFKPFPIPQGKQVSYTFFLTLLVSLFFSTNALAQDTQPRVLFISSYSYAWETVPEQINGIQQALDEDVQLDYQFMDTKNCTSEKSAALFYQSMKQYLSEVPAYDALIVGDDAALQFALQYQEELFPDIPIAFEGVNDLAAAADASENPLVCGVTEKLSYKNTITFASKIYPKAKRIVAILDDTITGESERKEFFGHQKLFPELTFDEINVSELTQKEFKKKISELDYNTILLYIMCSHDTDGHNYVGSQAIELVSDTAHIPTFSIVSIGMGRGVLGGEIVSQKGMGHIAGEMVQKYLDGEDFSQFTLRTDSPKTYRFDEDIMRKYNISASELPSNAELIHHRATFIEQNIAMIKISIVVGIVLLLLLLLLAIDNVRRRRLNNELEKAKYSLQNALKYDALTGLHNRAIFMETIQKKIDEKKSFALILYDVDHFKNINDTLGHNNGDIVLKEVAMRTLRLCNDKFTIYRLGGDEFTAIVDSSNPEVVKKYARKIQEAFSQSFVLEKQEHHIHSSIGVAMFPQDADNRTDLIAAADQAMYQVKKNGRNAFAFYKKKE